MSEQFREPKFSRRPADIPPDWPTRHDAQLALGLTGYLLRKYITAITTDDPDAATQYREYAGVGYLSPQLVAAIRARHEAVEKKQEEYLSMDAVQAYAECGYETLLDLIRQHPPDATLGEVRQLRDHNSVSRPHYSHTYARRLRNYHLAAAVSGKPGRRRSQPSTVRPTIPPGPLRQPRPLAEPPIVLNEASVDQYTAEARAWRNRLDRLPKAARSAQAIQLIVQWGMATRELQVTGQFPRGWENLVRQSRRILGEDEE